MSIVHVASNHCDKHEALVKSIQAIAAEWNLLNAKGHATARKGGELLEKYEDVYLHRKYMEMVESGVFGVCKSTCQKWMRVWQCRDHIKDKCTEQGLDYETIGMKKALELIGTPRKKASEQEDEAHDGSDGDLDEDDDVVQPEIEESAAAMTKVKKRAGSSGRKATVAHGKNDPTSNGDEPKGSGANESQDEQGTAELTVTILSTFRPKVPLREIKEKLANKKALLRWVLSVQAVSADGSEEILGEGAADTISEWQWSDIASQEQHAQVAEPETGEATCNGQERQKLAPADDKEKYF